jgi:hypothetical protein
VVLGVSIAIGVAAGLIWTSGLAVAGVAALAGLCMGGVLLLTTSSKYRIFSRLCAGVLVFVSGILLLGCVALTFRLIRPDILAVQAPAAILQQPGIVGTVLLVGGAGIAFGGASVVGRDSIRLRDFTWTVGFGIAALGIPGLALGGLVLIDLINPFGVSEGVGITVDILLGRAGTGPINYVGLVVAWMLAVGGLTAVRFGMRYLPIAELAPSTHRDRLSDQLDRGQSVLYRLRLLIIVSPVGILVLDQIQGLAPALDRGLRILSGIATMSVLRGGLLGAILLGVAGVVLGGATKRFAGMNPSGIALRVTPFVGGLVFVAAALRFAPDIVNVAVSGAPAEYRPVVEQLLRASSPATLAVAVVVIAGATPVVLYFGLLVVDYLLLPEYADGGALLSVGLFVVAVGSLLSGRRPLVGFAGIAGSFVVWDLITNAVSLGQEVGRHTPTRQTEIVHLGGSLLVATLGIGVAVTGLLLAEGISSPPERIAPVAGIISVVGLFALIFGLKSR